MRVKTLLQKMTVIALLQLLFTACSTPALVSPTVTPHPPTETPIPPTETPIPPSVTPEPTATPIPTKKVPSITEMVDVGGYKLRLNCIGEGSPTVVLESDIASDMYAWKHVLSENPTDMGIRVCVYNRSGLGYPKGNASEVAPN